MSAIIIIQIPFGLPLVSAGLFVQTDSKDEFIYFTLKRIGLFECKRRTDELSSLTLKGPSKICSR